MAAVSTNPPQRAGLLSEIESLLRNRYRFFAEIRDGVEVPRKIRAMLLYSVIFFALFGLVIGSDYSVWQALASGVKLPLLFLITLVVCFPALYFFNTIFEASLSLSQNFALLLASITMTSAVLLGFAPVVLFFLITTSQYQLDSIENKPSSRDGVGRGARHAGCVGHTQSP
jgi:hypothetical protein